jgi:hypothetical protein
MEQYWGVAAVRGGGGDWAVIRVHGCSAIGFRLLDHTGAVDVIDGAAVAVAADPHAGHSLIKGTHAPRPDACLLGGRVGRTQLAPAHGPGELLCLPIGRCDAPFCRPCRSLSPVGLRSPLVGLACLRGAQGSWQGKVVVIVPLLRRCLCSRHNALQPHISKLARSR